MCVCVQVYPGLSHTHTHTDMQHPPPPPSLQCTEPLTSRAFNPPQYIFRRGKERTCCPSVALRSLVHRVVCVCVLVRKGVRDALPPLPLCSLADGRVCSAALGDAPPTPPLTPPSTLPPRRGRRPRNGEEVPRPRPAALMPPGPRDASMLKHMLTVAGRQAAGGGAGTLEGRRSLGGGANQGPSGVTLPGLHHHHLHLQQQQQHLASPPPQQVLSVKVNGAAGGRHHPALNMSSLSSSKHSVGGNSGSGSPGTTTVTRTTGLDHSRDHSHLTDLSHISHLSPIQPVDLSKATLASKQRAASLLPRFITLTRASSARVALTSLGLLCLTSLLLALLALTFLVELTPLALDADSVQEVTLALAALTLSLDLSCLLICAAQFIFAIKLAKSPNGEERMSKYLRQSSVSRVCAVGGFFVSVPIFLTGVILYTFIHFQSTPAILTSVFIGVGIIFCGCAMIHNVFIWQKEKTKAMAQQNIQQAVSQEGRLRDLNVSPLPNATLDLSGVTPPHELSTLV